MSPKPPSASALRVSDLPQNRPHTFELRPDAPMLKVIAAQLELTDLRKLRFVGQIEGMGQSDWRLTGSLGATVVQPCVVTLEPVMTRIDTPVERLYVRDFETPDEEEVEMDADERTEALGAWIDPAAVMVEALSLAVPLYPRKDDAELGEAIYAEGDVTPMTDDDAKPFAGLAALRDKLTDGAGDD